MPYPPPSLRRVDPPGRPGRFRRLYARASTTRPMRAVSRVVGWRVDPILLRLTGGRVASTLVFPSAVLETTGARSGATRRNAVLYFHDVDDVIIVASHAGADRHPGWLHNVRADPDVTFGGTRMRATEVGDGVDRDRLWSLADRAFPAFPRYRARAAAAGRTIPIVRLSEVRG